jgi:cystathionine beta-lyase/cystathionine gamma-synthase
VLVSNRDDHIDTRLIHAGEQVPRVFGAVSLPVFQSSTYEYAGQGNYDDLKYIRMNNTPNHTALHLKLAAVENAEAALVTGSGMGAITTTLLTFLKPGDHMLSQGGLYGGTHAFILEDLAGMNISCDFVSGDDPEQWEQRLTPQTRLFYCESITNPLVQVADLAAIAAFCRKHQLVSIIDNTFATPVNFQPASLGFDLSLHSCTKYLNGHSDIVAGAVVGGREAVAAVAHRLVHLGATLDPHACFLLHRGLKTLALRMRCQNESALAIARHLEGHPKVVRVNYPGLDSHPHHRRAARLFDGFGGMLSFELEGDVAAADRFIARTRLPILAPSLGGVETLITRPATTSHAGMSPEDRHAMGISDRLIRLSVGIEAVDDLLGDLVQALETA